MPTITETKCTCKACGHIWYYGKSEVWQQAGNVLHNAGTAASCFTCSPCCMLVPDKPVKDLSPVDAIEMLQLTDTQFHERFRHTPLWRPKRSGLLRNAAIVLGNSGDRRAVPALIDALADEEPLVRDAAAWALGQLGGEQAVAALQSLAARRGENDQ